MENVKIEIRDNTILSRPIEKDGKRYNFREMIGWAHVGQPYPMQIKISLSDDQTGYAPGMYALGGASYQVGRFGSLEFARRLELIPIPSAGVQKAA